MTHAFLTQRNCVSVLLLSGCLVVGCAEQVPVDPEPEDEVTVEIPTNEVDIVPLQSDVLESEDELKGETEGALRFPVEVEAAMLGESVDEELPNAIPKR